MHPARDAVVSTCFLIYWGLDKLHASIPFPLLPGVLSGRTEWTILYFDSLISGTQRSTTLYWPWICFTEPSLLVCSLSQHYCNCGSRSSGTASGYGSPWVWFLYQLPCTQSTQILHGLSYASLFIIVWASFQSRCTVEDASLLTLVVCTYKIAYMAWIIQAFWSLSDFRSLNWENLRNFLADCSKNAVAVMAARFWWLVCLQMGRWNSHPHFVLGHFLVVRLSYFEQIAVWSKAAVRLSRSTFRSCMLLISTWCLCKMPESLCVALLLLDFRTGTRSDYRAIAMHVCISIACTFITF